MFQLLYLEVECGCKHFPVSVPVSSFAQEQSITQPFIEVPLKALIIVYVT